MQKEHSKLLLKTTNSLLDYLAKMPEIPCGMPPINTLINYLKVSRTTLIKLIKILCDKGIVRQDGHNQVLLRKPVAEDYFLPEEIDNSKSDIIEKHIIQKLSSYSLKPGDRFSELELARELNTNTIIIREALFKIAQSGIIKKHPRQKWEVIEFSSPMIDEITAVRQLYEGYALQSLKSISSKDTIWADLKKLENKHKQLLKQSQVSATDMREVEQSFHGAIIRACDNRFMQKSYNSIFTLIFFHLGQIEYDQAKIERVLKQHLQIIEAILKHDFDHALQLMASHLEHAKLSMKNTMSALS